MVAHPTRSSRCPTFTLDDAPADKDDLGSHEPIAAAIHELVMGEPGGRTIGLEGRWGSGKSTVVRLLDERMRGPDAHLVVFDVWAHEGDPLRRSFLETLIDSLREKRWIDSEAWRARRENLAVRRGVEHTRPRITKHGVVASAATALVAMLVPTAVALLSAGLALGASGIWIPGAAILSVLVLAVIFLAVRLLLRWPDATGDSWLVPFSVRSVTESDRETIETPDPTSLEFERVFRKLMSDALGGCPERRLALVVDNLDRVAPEDARSVWATLQTFLHHPHDPRATWLRSLWVVLPFDRAGINRLWDGSDEAADSFLDKSIQVHFEVPLPLLTDWREYLASLLHDALPEHAGDDYTVYRLFQYRPSSRERAPSPRELKLYVNRIGALHRRWQHELSFGSLAYYASLGKAADDVAQDLRSDRLPTPDVTPLLDAHIEGHLAALAFNTAPERALQLLHGPRIDNALMREEADGLLDLAGRPGFWEALMGSAFVRVPSSAAPSLLLAASRLAEIPEEIRPAAEWGEVTELLARAGRESDGWPPLTPESASRLSYLLSLVGRPAAEEIAARATAAPLRARDGADWATGAHALLSRFEWLTVWVSGDAETICDALVAFSRIAGWGEFVARLAVEPDDRAALDAALARRVAVVPGEALPALAVLRRVGSDIEWAPLVTAAAGRLRDYAPSHGAAEQPSAGEARSLLGIIRAAVDGSPRERAALAREGLALEYAGIASGQDDDSALGDWLYEALRWSTPEERLAFTHRNHSRQGMGLLDGMLEYPSSERVGPLVRAIRRLPDFDLIPVIREQTGGEHLADALIDELDMTS